jgi:hypothetical protein
LAPIAAVLIGLILGQTYSSAWDIPSSKNPNSISDQEVVIDQGAIARQDNVNSKEENNAVILFRTLTNNLGIIESIENKRNLNSIGAESALPQSSCVDQSQDLIRILKCNAVELPYRLFAFLFRPLIFFDEGSLLLKLASIENLGWLLILPYGLFIAIRRNTNPKINLVKFYLATFILTFSAAAALYEGNLGTAFRHKSSILWPLILILLLSKKNNAERK